MAAELVGGAALGAMFGEFLHAVLKVKDNVVEFKPKMMEMEETLRTLAPVIEEIEELNTRLNGPDQSETQSLMKLMEEGRNLVSKCLHIRWWNIIQKSRFHKKLVELDNKILRFHNLHMQALILRQVNRISRDLINVTPKVVSLNDRRRLHGGEVRRIRLQRRFRDHLEAARHFRDHLEAADLMVSDFSSPKMEAPRSHIAELIRRAEPICRAFRSVFEKCVSNIWIVMEDAVMLKTTMEQLEATMGSLSDFLQQIELHNIQEVIHGADQGEVESIKRLMEEGRKPVRECSNIGRWNFLKKWRYQKMLAELDNKLLRLHSLHLQALMAKNHATTRNGSEKHVNEPQK